MAVYSWKDILELFIKGGLGMIAYAGFIFGIYYIITEVDFRRVTGLEWLLSGILLMLILIYFKIRK
tara:strand:- start:15 stop:212 length:198 start_codon:yes stop_codon:yes gene_type:complete